MYKDMHGKKRVPFSPYFLLREGSPTVLHAWSVVPGCTKFWIQGTSAQRQNFAIDMAGLHKARWKVHRELHKSRSGHLDHSEEKKANADPLWSIYFPCIMCRTCSRHKCDSVGGERAFLALKCVPRADTRNPSNIERVVQVVDPRTSTSSLSTASVYPM